MSDSDDWSTCVAYGGRVRMLSLPLMCYFMTSRNLGMDCADGVSTVDNQFEYTQSIATDLDMTVERPRFELSSGRRNIVEVSVRLPNGTRKKEEREKRYAEKFLKRAKCKIPLEFGKKNQVTITITMKEGSCAWSTHVWTITHDSKEPEFTSSVSEDSSSDESSSS